MDLTLFQGLPDSWRKGQEKGHFDVGGATPDISDDRVELSRDGSKRLFPVLSGTSCPGIDLSCTSMPTCMDRP